MASLKHCIGKLVEAGEVSKYLAVEAERLATEHTNDGYSRERAEAVALEDLLREAKSELSSVYKQLGIKPVIDNLPDELSVWGDGKATVKAMREAVSREPYRRVLEKFIAEGNDAEGVAEAQAALDSKDAKRIMKMAQKIEAQSELQLNSKLDVERVSRGMNPETGNEVVTLNPINETAGPVGARTTEMSSSIEKSKTNFLMLDKDGNQVNTSPVYEVVSTPKRGRNQHHGISEEIGRAHV